MSLKSKLALIVGENFVSDGAAERYVYSQDITENQRHEPALVVMPATVEEVQRIVLLANEELTPLVPYVTGQNVGGLTIPQVDGAVIVDLKRMDRILDVDEEGMYMVVEPGVTFGHVRKFLDENHPSLRYAYPIAPPYTSVMANALLQGLCDLSTSRGAMADFINGLEVVLPTGEITCIGSGIMGDDNWFGRYPLPDLVGLFSGWQGMTGIVTKIALKLWPKKKFVQHYALFTFGENETAEILKESVRTGIIDDAGCLSFPVVKMLMEMSPPVMDFEGEPDYGSFVTIRGDTEIEVEENYKLLKALVNRYKERDNRLLLIPFDAIAKLIYEGAHAWVDFPSDGFKPLTQFDGMSWVGVYIHPRYWGEALAGGRRIVEKYGFEEMIFLKPMDGMHYAEYKHILRFPKDKETLEKVRKCNEELLDHALELKAIPYKTPIWAAKKLHERADPEFLKLVKRIKKLLDPNGIMNPGRLSLS